MVSNKQTRTKKSIVIFLSKCCSMINKKKVFRRKVNQTLISLTNFAVPFGNLQGLGFVSYFKTNTNFSELFGSGKWKLQNKQIFFICVSVKEDVCTVHLCCQSSALWYLTHQQLSLYIVKYNWVYFTFLL